MSDFDTCIEKVLRHEGGYVNDKNDLGGETNLGVTKKTYTQWCMEQDLLVKDMKDLTVDDVKPIYKRLFWERMMCDDLPVGLRYFVFDFGINSGTGRAVKFLQKLAGSVEDGAMGPKTLEAVKQQDAVHMVDDIFEMRQEFYESLDSFEHFGRGWTKRNNEVHKDSLRMIVS